MFCWLTVKRCSYFLPILTCKIYEMYFIPNRMEGENIAGSLSTLTRIAVIFNSLLSGSHLVRCDTCIHFFFFSSFAFFLSVIIYFAYVRNEESVGILSLCIGMYMVFFWGINLSGKTAWLKGLLNFRKIYLIGFYPSLCYRSSCQMVTFYNQAFDEKISHVLSFFSSFVSMMKNSRHYLKIKMSMNLTSISISIKALEK